MQAVVIVVSARRSAQRSGSQLVVFRHCWLPASAESLEPVAPLSVGGARAREHFSTSEPNTEFSSYLEGLEINWLHHQLNKWLRVN